MPNGLTKHGTCRTSCSYGGDNIAACCHPDYVKAINEGRICPEDPRTKKEIENDIVKRRQYFQAKEYLTSNKKLLGILKLSKEERIKMIEEAKQNIKEAQTIIRQYESKNQS
jgi:hypothetical protein